MLFPGRLFSMTQGRRRSFSKKRDKEAKDLMGSSDDLVNFMYEPLFKRQKKVIRFEITDLRIGIDLYEAKHTIFARYAIYSTIPLLLYFLPSLFQICNIIDIICTCPYTLSTCSFLLCFIGLKVHNSSLWILMGPYFLCRIIGKEASEVSMRLY